jgi:fructose-1,6-bisphosphatase/inositol monophosphatase family enzyme
MSNLSKELQTAIDAAKLGADEARKYFRNNIAFEVKDDKTIVTAADTASENVIKSHITSNFPNAAFVAEESGGSRDKDAFWVVDPIDGTRAFARGISQWSILIAYYANHQVQLGLCYLPTLDMLVYAERGHGTYFNGEKVQVSDIAKAKEAYSNVGSMRHFKDFAVIEKLTRSTAAVRSYEHAYGMCYLVSGGMDIEVDANAKTWDYAPFVCMLEEAGGKITDMQGNPWNLGTSQVIATNGLLHDEVVNIVNGK